MTDYTHRRRHRSSSVLYWELARVGFRRFARYRAATVGAAFTNTVFGFIRAYLFIAVFAQARVIGGLNLQDALTYAFLVQAMLMTIQPWGWWEIAVRIRSGDIVTDLLKPFGIEAYWLAQDYGRATYSLLFRGIPPFLVGLAFFDLYLPTEWVTWLALGPSLALAIAASFGLRFIANLTAFWLLDSRGVGSIVTAAWTFLAGFVVPIAFFPSPLRTIAAALPFAATLQVPIEIFLETRHGIDVAWGLAFQLLWTIILLFVGKRILAIAVHKVVAQGG